MISHNLIQIPTELYGALEHYVLGNFLSYIHTIDPSLAEYLGLVFDIGYDKKHFELVNGTCNLSNFILPSYMPREYFTYESYKQNYGEFGGAWCLIDWEQKIWPDRPKVNASYEETDEKGLQGYFIINPRRIIEFMADPERRDTKAVKLFKRYKWTMYHECTHFIQHNILKNFSPKQIEKSHVVRDNPDSSKEDRRKEYLLSYVEYDPTIKTKIGVYQRSHAYPTNESIKVFVGAQKGDKDPDEFFKCLHDNNYELWKRAVKKFYMNIGIDIYRFPYAPPPPSFEKAVKN